MTAAVRDRKARRTVRALIITGWLLGAASAWLAREHEPAFAWFVGITAVVLVFVALAVAHSAAEESERSDAEVTGRRITVRRRTVTTTDGDEIDVTTEDDEIHP